MMDKNISTFMIPYLFKFFGSDSYISFNYSFNSCYSYTSNFFSEKNFIKSRALKYLFYFKFMIKIKNLENQK